MSSSPSRDPLSGVIRQDTKVVGAICLPREDVQEFINEFNHCYGPLSMHIDAAQFPTAAEATLFPVGAQRPRGIVLGQLANIRPDSGER